MSFFKTLKGEAKTHVTRVICEDTRVSLCNEEVESVELSSLLSKQKLYYCFCFQSRYVVKSNAKGRMPSLRSYPVYDTCDIQCLEGRNHLFMIGGHFIFCCWKDNYPNMKICSPANNTCNSSGRSCQCDSKSELHDEFILQEEKEDDNSDDSNKHNNHENNSNNNEVASTIMIYYKKQSGVHL